MYHNNVRHEVLITYTTSEELVTIYQLSVNNNVINKK
jgi:hypothetical protein